MLSLQSVIFFLTVWFVYNECRDIYEDRPKIKTLNGDLIIEPAVDKNIYLRTNGPKSTIFVQDFNLLNVTTNNRGTNLPSPNTNFDWDLNGPNGILQRLDRLERTSRVQPPTDAMWNYTFLSRRVNRQNTMISNLRQQIINLSEDKCESRPCRNGGTCLSLVTGYHCLCPSNWEGHDCDVDVNECRNFAGTDLGCQNGAECINRPGSYECQCRNGWFGIHCTRKTKDCSGGNYEMCGHGTCVPVQSGEGITCICDQGWTTNGSHVSCLTDINECESSQYKCSVNPKVECINLPGSYRCGQCPSGYEGDGYICSDVDECVTLPNGGCSTSPMVSCHNTIGSRICGPCPPGYQGDGVTCTWRGSCNINRGGCHPSAECVDSSGSGQAAQCICPPGMDGDGFGLQGCYVSNDTRGCESNPCGAHGQCHPLRQGYTCICARGYGGTFCDMPVDYCARIPCLNGGSCRPDESASRGFRCECTAQYSGDVCQEAVKTCGGILQKKEGSIVYPLTNTTYNHNIKCAWVIQTSRDKVLNITFTKFNLELAPECSYDFLQIHDGRNPAANFIGRFCGNTLPKGGNFQSTTNNLYLWFRTDQSQAYEGFALHWTSVNPVCGGEIDASTHGHIQSPGSPGNYPPNRDCYWHLSAPLGKRIQLHFFALDIEIHETCSNDFLAIYDGPQTSDPLLGKFCNSTHPAPLETTGSEMMIHFHSDEVASGKGFQITYAPIEGIPGCGGLFTMERGDIVSPSYNGKYLNNLVCEYKIKISSDSKIRLNFSFFQLETSVRCQYDYLKVYDGPSSESRLVGKFCGTSYPKQYISSSNTLYIIFKTDTSSVHEGFRLTYDSICQQTIIGDSGVIKTPGYPFNYPEHKVCEYILGTSIGKAIQLTFQDFDVEDSTNDDSCIFDYVEVRDGVNRNASLLGKYCGGPGHIPPVKTSTYNYMYVKFHSDASLTATGFYANFTSVDIHCGGIHRDNIGTISYPIREQTSYENNENCTWILIAPEGRRIVVTWDRFDVEATPNCRSDYLELVELVDNERYSLNKYCGSKKPPALTIPSNQLEINFVTDYSVKAMGFSLSYIFLNEKTDCSGTYLRSHGFINSPGWPKKYELNRDCTWMIQVPAGQQIKLNISQFELEQAIRYKCDFGDYLEIRNGHTNQSPLIGKFCGTIKSKFIVSFSNTLYLRFHSDGLITKSGFHIEWTSTTSGCGGTLNTPSGSIVSPGYPDGYEANAECFYKIVTSAGTRIHISFKEIELERTIDCQDDYVEIFDGRDENAPSLGKYCHMLPHLNNIQTTSNYAFVKFRTDFYIADKGFALEYFSICENNITGLHGIIESPGYPDQYPAKLNCLYTINVPKGNKINVTFTHFDVAMQRSWWANRPVIPSYRFGGAHVSPVFSCRSDYLQLKESSDPVFGDRQCGTDLNLNLKRFTTKTNSLQIKFVTGEYYSATGFRLEWARYGCGGLINKRFGFITLDRNIVTSGELECEWVIEGQSGKRITIQSRGIYMTDTVNCSTDAVEFYNGRSSNAPLIARVCHKESARLHSTSNFMTVRLVKRSNLRDISLNVYFDSFASGCGGMLNSRSGIIHSDNYPTRNYENNLDCIWIISVPEHHRVEVNFMDFDLYSEDGDDCKDNIKIYDENYLDLYNNYSQIICPSSKVNKIISKFNTLGIKFSTDSSGSAKGFKLNYTATCGGVINAKYDGIITNDKFANYDINCTWTIMAPSPDQKISLTISHINIPKDTDVVTARNCPSYYLRVLDGNDENAPLIDEYCGKKVPPMIVSHGSALTIQLGSYNTKTVRGVFSAHYTTMSSACGGILTSEEGSIASPNYPLSYPSHADCEWTLSTSPGNKVYITFEQFDINFSDECNEDYLEVREKDGGGKLLGLYCGNEIPTNTTAATKLYIKFHADDKGSRRGFLIHYGFLHGNQIVGQETGEIASPLYPYKYTDSGEYTWLVLTNAKTTITVTIDILEIPVHGEDCYNNLMLYDGYNEDAPQIDQICGLVQESKIYHTSSNALFIKMKLNLNNLGSLFHLYFASSNKDVETDLDENKINCGLNETKLIQIGEVFSFTSPGYPNEYKINLKCEWIFKAMPGYHLSLEFQEIDMESTSDCFADSISIFSADKLGEWKPIQERICSSDFTQQASNSTSFLKVKFISDASVNRKGFRATIRSVCGGLISASSGVIGPVWKDLNSNLYYNALKCQWIIKVRPSRIVSFYFEHFNITNSQNDCSTSVTIRNGDSTEAPLLGSGKYCGYSHENRSKIESSSNSIFVSYLTATARIEPFKSFRLRFEEKNFECGVTSTLDENHNWEIFNSPNYPNVPFPYADCVWIFTGPPGEILKIDFLERFDLDQSFDCTSEYIEIKDGATELAPSKGKYCGRDPPGTIKTTGNVIYINYFSDKSEPGNGFKANVSIDTCGGTIKASSGELVSPGYPHMQRLPAGTVCEWRIIGPPWLVLKIKTQDVDLPLPDAECGVNLTIEEVLGTSINIISKICSDEVHETSVFETSSNEAVIKLHVGVIGIYSGFEGRGFRFTFNSSRPVCGGRLTTNEGYLMTPGYPRQTKIRYCRWTIKVPDESRRIRLNLIDADTESHTIGMFNDLAYNSPIQILTPGQNSSDTPSVFESTGNILSIYLRLNKLDSQHRFKARFTSDEEALCGGKLNSRTGQLSSPPIDRAYNCKWNYQYEGENITKYQTFSVNVRTNSSKSVKYLNCIFSSTPKVVLKFKHSTGYYANTRTLCVNRAVTLNLPTNVLEITAITDKENNFDFNLNWELQPCGGTIQLTLESVNVISIPDNYNRTIDCAWLIVVPITRKAQFKLEGEFQLECEDENITISEGLHDYSNAIGEYCKDRTQAQPINTFYRSLLVQYHSKIKSITKIKLIASVTNSVCGGTLTYKDKIFESPNFPQKYDANTECTWEIIVELGNRINLKFIDRFVVEKKENCTKDSVTIFDWKNGSYSEIAKVCGRDLPPNFNSTSNKMKVVFKSDTEINLDGFRAHFESICGGYLIATETVQYIYSPGYPYQYPPLLDCKYIITSDDKMLVKFEEFELERTYPSCAYDNITIIGQGDYLYNVEGTYCENNIPPPLKKYKKVEVQFKTDAYISRRGFKISYVINKCSNTIKEPKTLTLGAEDYDISMNCTWHIEAPTNQHIVLKFQYIDLEGSSYCSSDYLSVFEGSKLDETNRLALLCGHINSTLVLRSTSNNMLLQMVTDYSVLGQGFEVEIFFSLSESVGCGGHINLTETSYTLSSPLIGSNVVYENSLDCHWTIYAPTDYSVKVDFSSFHIASCGGVNQTALGINNCECDFVELKDGFNPDDLSIGKFCGHTIPPQIISSGNKLSITFITDGSIVSSGFKATLSLQKSACGKMHYTSTHNVQSIQSPDYSLGMIPRGTHCTYYVSENDYETIRVTIKNLDIRPGEPDENQCNKDRLLIFESTGNNPNISIGTEFTMNGIGSMGYSPISAREYQKPQRFIFCGKKQSLDLYFDKSITIYLQTSSDSDSKTYKGIELQVVKAGACGRNYTESQGRIKSHYDLGTVFENNTRKYCYTLITVPENNTISIYFIQLTASYTANDNEVFLEIYDGNSTSNTKIIRGVSYSYGDLHPVFSSSNYLLLHHHNEVLFDIIYTSTDKGKGCGGKFYNVLGTFTSPLYPDNYRRRGSCEWEVETPVETLVKLHFVEFDMGVACHENYLQIVDRLGNVISSFCEEIPADYTSTDNYVKVVFTTTLNNGGTGFLVEFMATR